mgnify:CR=1 FL=1
MSPSSRRAWIEIICCPRRKHCRPSPSSRRAWIEIVKSGAISQTASVALLAEGVDRNMFRPARSPVPRRVALLAEGVDRNHHGGVADRNPVVALLAEGVDRNSAAVVALHVLRVVALLAEGVDRNIQRNSSKAVRVKSPSSRRAWIEIPSTLHTASRILCRPPRGGRG